MFFSTLEIAEPGFLFVYLSYENESDNWVYFDDLKITHTPTNIVQYNDYYPYGLQTSASWTREDSGNNHLYNQGNELNSTSGWDETFFRNYDPALGRFTSVDPLASKFASLSGYHYAYNNPVMFNDPLGAQGEPGNPWFSGGYRWMENMSPPPAAYNSMGASTFGSTMDNYWYQAMNSANNWGEQMMHQSQLASQARGGDMGAVREYAARYGGGLMPVEIWHSTAQAGGETYYHYEVVPGEGRDGSFIYNNKDAIGLGFTIVEPGLGAAWDAVRSNPGAYTKGAINIAKGAGAGVVVLNVALTGYIVNQEFQNKSYNTHTLFDVAVTSIGAGLVATGLFVTSPVWGTGLAIGGAVIGVGYGIATVAGFDDYIDNATDNWGRNIINDWMK